MRTAPLTVMQSSAARRALSFGVVAALHGLLLAALLTATGTMPAWLPALRPATLIMDVHPPPPLPPRVQPRLPAPPLFVPTPEIEVAAPPRQSTAPRAITRTAPAAATAGHFGAATDSGLSLDIGTASGGGAGTRGTLAGFEAAVRARVLAGKRQPGLAWDRRRTCVVNYRVTVARGGGLAGFSIDPCAVAEINEAAREAIRRAAPFPPPPDLGAPTVEVHGSLVFTP